MPKPDIDIAKITPPVVAGTLLRERLFDLLDEGREGSLIWVTAPGGAGKTTLVAQWLAARKLPHLWCRLDAGDDDPSSFFHYLSLAATRAFPRRKQPLPHLTPEYSLGMPIFARHFFEKLCTRLPRNGLAVVLDNYQEVAEEAPLHDLLLSGIEALPAGATVIVLSRSESPASFMRLRANRQMSTIGWRALRFTLDEACAILPPTQAERLHKETDGWAAGLRLALEADYPAPANVSPQSISTIQDSHSDTWRDDAFAYFAGEIMRHTDPSLRDFLYATSLLPFATEEIAAQLSGRDDAGVLLRNLSRRNFFTERHPGNPPSYLYHPLFHKFLQQEAAVHQGAEWVTARQRQGARMLAQSGHPESALELYLAAGDYHSVIPLLSTLAWPLLSQGRSEILNRWLDKLPEAVLSVQPDLLFVAGRCRMMVDPGAARALLQRAISGYQAASQSAKAIQACGAYLEALMVEGKEYKASPAWVERLDRLVHDDNPAVATAVERIAGVVVFALSYCDLEYPSLPWWREKAEAALLNTDDPATTLRMCNYLLAHYMFSGDFADMTRLMTVLRPLRRQIAADPSLRLLTLVLDAYYAFFVQGAPLAVNKLARTGLGLAAESGIRIYDFWLYFLLIISGLSINEQEMAEEKIQELLAWSPPLPTGRLGSVYSLAGSSAMLKQQWGEAISLLQRAAILYEQDGNVHTSLNTRIHLSMALYNSGEQEAAHRQLVRVADQNWAGSAFIRYHALILSAWFDYCEERHESGLRSLRKAMELARQKGMTHAPFQYLDAFARLCASALDAGIETEFVTRLIRMYQLTPPEDMVSSDTWPWPIRIETLGHFRVFRDGEAMQFTGGLQKKPLEMLKAIIAFGGYEVPEERIMDALWPESEGDAARSTAKNALHRLRKGLGDDCYIQLKQGRLSLSREHCWVDINPFLAAPGKAWHAGIPRALARYKGAFLADDDAASWSVAMRERARRHFLRLLNVQAGELVRQGKIDQAVHYYEQAIDIDELNEDHYHHLMKCYGLLGRRDQVARTYQHCKEALQSHLGIVPSERVQTLYRELLDQ